MCTSTTRAIPWLSIYSHIYTAKLHGRNISVTGLRSNDTPKDRGRIDCCVCFHREPVIYPGVSLQRIRLNVVCVYVYLSRVEREVRFRGWVTRVFDQRQGRVRVHCGLSYSYCALFYILLSFNCSCALVREERGASSISVFKRTINIERYAFIYKMHAG